MKNEITISVVQTLKVPLSDVAIIGVSLLTVYPLIPHDNCVPLSRTTVTKSCIQKITECPEQTTHYYSDTIDTYLSKCATIGNSCRFVQLVFPFMYFVFLLFLILLLFLFVTFLLFLLLRLLFVLLLCCCCVPVLVVFVFLLHLLLRFFFFSLFQRK